MSHVFEHPSRLVQLPHGRSLLSDPEADFVNGRTAPRKARLQVAQHCREGQKQEFAAVICARCDAHLSAAAQRFLRGRYFCSCSARNCAFSAAFASRSCDIERGEHSAENFARLRPAFAKQ